ncbi:MAG: hypothetical protein GX639_06325 [Fibrobacter sp.]|nr:hypothetical protein [Fibrobacter sp.]
MRYCASYINININIIINTIQGSFQKYWAVVLPEKVVGQMNMKRFSDDYSKAGITAKLFSDPDEALKWVESV